MNNAPVAKLVACADIKVPSISHTFAAAVPIVDSAIAVSLKLLPTATTAFEVSSARTKVPSPPAGTQLDLSAVVYAALSNIFIVPTKSSYPIVAESPLESVA